MFCQNCGNKLLGGGGFCTGCGSGVPGVESPVAAVLSVPVKVAAKSKKGLVIAAVVIAVVAIAAFAVFHFTRPALDGWLVGEWELETAPHWSSLTFYEDGTGLRTQPLTWNTRNGVLSIQTYRGTVPGVEIERFEQVYYEYTVTLNSLTLSPIRARMYLGSVGWGWTDWNYFDNPATEVFRRVR